MQAVSACILVSDPSVEIGLVGSCSCRAVQPTPCKQVYANASEVQIRTLQRSWDACTMLLQTF